MLKERGHGQPAMTGKGPPRRPQCASVHVPLPGPEGFTAHADTSSPARLLLGLPPVLKIPVSGPSAGFSPQRWDRVHPCPSDSKGQSADHEGRPEAEEKLSVSPYEQGTSRSVPVSGARSRVGAADTSSETKDQQGAELPLQTAEPKGQKPTVLRTG